MNATSEPEAVVRYYAVDEAGDSTLFGKRGKVIVGTPGCSKFFILGMLDVREHKKLRAELEELRVNLMNDPYFKGVPSMSPDGGKTALCFHAKDDLAEVRHEVFKVLVRHDLKFLAIVRDKREILKDVLLFSAISKSYRYDPNEVYDGMVSRLFRDKLHKEDKYNIVFAKRGRSDRTAALHKALNTAKVRFYNKCGVSSEAPIRLYNSIPKTSPSLQAVDYFLWALQRLYERGESRYVEFLQERLSLVIDLDDTREAPYGMYYSKQKPLTRAAWEAREGI